MNTKGKVLLMPDSMDWVKANVRSCKECSRETDALEWPEWPEGICEECDPLILLGYVACDACGEFYEKQWMAVIEDILDHSSRKIVRYTCLVCIGD